MGVIIHPRIHLGQKVIIKLVSWNLYTTEEYGIQNITSLLLPYICNHLVS